MALSLSSHTTRPGPTEAPSAASTRGAMASLLTRVVRCAARLSQWTGRVRHLPGDPPRASRLRWLARAMPVASGGSPWARSPSAVGTCCLNASPARCAARTRSQETSGESPPVTVCSGRTGSEAWLSSAPKRRHVGFQAPRWRRRTRCHSPPAAGGRSTDRRPYDPPSTHMAVGAGRRGAPQGT